MIYNLLVYYNIYYFQVVVYVFCYIGVDDIVGLEGMDQFYSIGSSVYFIYFVFYQDNGIIFNVVFSILERIFGVFFFVFEQLCYLFLFGIYGCYNFYFYNLILFMVVNVCILLEYIVFL